ncbi:MAG: NrfD/PsrC family molybdoenzyme membrane anchor subunit [Dehalobacterium sp.]
MKQHREEGWGWMLAVDFFFAGMGGGMLLIAGLIELFLGAGRISLLGSFLGPVFIGMGAGFLVLELGRPFQAWRVFMNPKAILTFGAWNMSVAIIAGFVYGSFGLDVFPWHDWITLRKIAALIAAITGLVVAAYPGVLLGRHKSRPFWTGAGMMNLFFTSSLVTGVAAHILSSLLYAPPLETGLKGLPWVTAGLLLFQLMLWTGYIWIKISGTTEREAVAARRWLTGDLAGSFKVFLLLGTLLPMILVLMSGDSVQGIGAGLVLLGGILMRLSVVKSGEDRTWLPGEEKYRSRLPLGHEEFLKAWNAK